MENFAPPPAGIISSVGTVTIDEAGIIESFDAVSERLFGYRQGEVQGQNVSRLMPEPYRSEHDQYLVRYRQEGSPRIIGKGREVTGLKRDGTRFPMWLAVNEVALAGKRLFVGSVVDLTEQKQAEAELCQHRNHLEDLVAIATTEVKAIVETALSGIITHDVHGVIHLFNPSAERLFGLARDEIAGRNITDLLSVSDAQQHLEDIRAWTSSANMQGYGISREVTALRQDGSWFPAHLAIGQMELPNGRRVFVAYINDITERRRAETQLKQARDDAEAGLRAKAAFIANMSHEIRTPMNAILGFAEVVTQDADLSTETARHVQIILNSARSLLSLINDVLDVSKLESGRFALESVPFNLPSLLHESLGLVERKATEKSLDLSIHYSGELAERVVGDPTRLRQVVLNLLSNAIKFTDHGGIVLSVAPGGEPHTVEFAVSDTGVGMSPDQLARIFKPFVQADASTTRRFGGTGLGTAISKQIVELMGGRIWAESSPDHGSIFRFIVPLHEALSTDICLYDEQSTLALASGYISPRTFDVLLVEDIEENALLATLRLREQGHRVTCAANGREAVDAFRETRPEIILMDVMMPEMDGLEATRRLREIEAHSGAHTPILALTASVMQEDFEKCREAGMDAVAGKPIDFNRLFAQMEQMVPEGYGTSNSLQTHSQVDLRCSDLSGLDSVARHEQAIRIWKDDSVYIRALRSFAEHHTEDANRIRKSLEEESSPFTSAHATAHALKGVAANLFLTQVASAASRLDEHLKMGRRDDALNAIASLDSALSRAAEAIGTLDCEAKAVTDPLRVYDPVIVSRLLNELHAALEALDPERAEPLVVRLRRFVSAPDLLPIQREIELFDFDSARDRTVALAARLGFTME